MASGSRTPPPDKIRGPGARGVHGSVTPAPSVPNQHRSPGVCHQPPNFRKWTPKETPHTVLGRRVSTAPLALPRALGPVAAPAWSAPHRCRLRFATPRKTSERCYVSQMVLQQNLVSVLCFETFKKQRFTVSDLYGLEDQTPRLRWPNWCLKFRRKAVVLPRGECPVKKAPKSL